MLALRIHHRGSDSAADELVAVVRLAGGAMSMTPLASDEVPGHRFADVYLDINADGAGVPGGRLVRLDVTFARVRGMTLVPLDQHSVYVNVDPIPKPTAPSAPPDPRRAAPPTQGGLDLAVDDRTIPLQEEIIREEVLSPGSPADREPLYWRELQRRVAWQWQRQGAAPRPSGRGREVSVLVVLGVSGDVRLAQVERSSGSRSADEAALLAVANAHPFSPFPPSLGGQPLTVHLRLPLK
jgi:TonB family protein